MHSLNDSSKLSSYTEYLPEGYKVDAHRYLLKNDDNFDESFSECMESVIAKIRMEETNNTKASDTKLNRGKRRRNDAKKMRQLPNN